MLGCPGSPDSPVSQAGSEDGFQLVVNARIEMPPHEPPLHEDDGQPLRLEAVSPEVTPTSSPPASPELRSPEPLSPATPARAPLADSLLKEENRSMQSEILRLQLENDALAARLRLVQAESKQLEESVVTRGLLVLRSLSRPVAATQLRGCPAHVPLGHACRQLCLALLYILCAIGLALFSVWRVACHAAAAAAGTVHLCCAGVRAVARHIAAHSGFYTGLVVGAAAMAVCALALASAAGVVTVPAIPRTLHLPVELTRLNRALNLTHRASSKAADAQAANADATAAAAMPSAGIPGGGASKPSKKWPPGGPASKPPLEVEAEPTRWQLASTAVRLYLPPLQLGSPAATANADATADAAPVHVQAAARPGRFSSEGAPARASPLSPPTPSAAGQQAKRKQRLPAALTARLRRLFGGSSALHHALPQALDHVAGALLGWPVGLMCGRGLMRLLQG